MTHAANEAGAVRIEDGTARILHWVPVFMVDCPARI